jgi:hypothetical protein
LRFELSAVVAEINTNFVRSTRSRRATLHTALGLFPNQDEVGVDWARRSVHDRLETLGGRLQALERLVVSSERESSNGELGALIFTKCLSCQAPGSSSKRPESPPRDPLRIQHGRPLGQNPANAKLGSDRPASAPINGFRFDAVRPYVDVQDLGHYQRQQNAADATTIHVGRRAGTFGVEKLRPRSRHF